MSQNRQILILWKQKAWWWCLTSSYKIYFQRFFWEVGKVTWRCGSALSEKRTEWIQEKVLTKHIDLQNNVLIWKLELEQLLSKEYQYKNSYQEKYYGINNVYGPWYLKHLDTMTHLEGFNIFDEKSNYERFMYPWRFLFYI